MSAKHLVLLLLALPAGWLAFAESSLTVCDVPGFPGTSAQVPIAVRNVTNLTAAQFDLAYDASKVTPEVLFAGRRFSNHVVRYRDVAPGVRRVLVYSRENAAVTATNGTSVAVAPFAVAPTEYVSSGPIVPGNVILARADATAIAPLPLNSGTIFIRPVNVLPNGHVQFFLPSTEGQQYVIQATTNLTDWVDLFTHTATSSFMDLVDIDAPAYPNYRFYRWQRLTP